ncbi:AraC family transcriptional regulator [Bradyrhizobium sp. CB82]|nr:AraC family transcriptional regulator [Bradyrhizobium sp. CB82]WFU42044.1 AraC family transcriptional regulator [Bradyrhizobium sp. CB82]
MSKRATAAVWVRSIAEMLAAEGLDVARLFAAAGIDPQELEAPGARLATEKISHLWELAVERSKNPALSLAQHEVVRPAAFDVVGYTMMSCADLRGAFERLNRYLLILSDALTMSMTEENDCCRIDFVLFGGSRPIPRQRIEFIFVTVIGFCRWIARSDINPRAIALTYPPPADISPYRAAFRCPVTFNAERNSVVLARKDLDLALPTFNPQLAELHERYAGEYLRHFDHAQTSFRVRESIVRRLPDGEPRRDEVAVELCMSERTLQRRLEEEATSFVQLLDDTRRELADQYLGRLHLSLGQAAYLLGFADQSSFFRACRRWFKASPGEYRNRLLQGVAAT